MKPNVKMIDKTKNSFIFFQLGLIAVMVTVLFALEFNFEVEENGVVAYNFPPFTEETVFVYNPKKEVAPKVKIEPAKQVVKQKVENKLINNFKESDLEVKDNVVKEQPNEENNNNVENATANKPNDLNIVDSSLKRDEKVYDFTETLPMFPACKGVPSDQQRACFDEELRKAIFKNLRYPEKDLNNDKEGSVFVQFIIDQNGNFTAINPIENNRGTADMRKAVESAVKKLPKIIPAKQGGRDVKMRYTIPITFKINK